MYSDSKEQIPREYTFQSPKDERGFVRGSTKFMVTDDLVVTILPSMSCFSYFQKIECGSAWYWGTGDEYRHGRGNEKRTLHKLESG